MTNWLPDVSEGSGPLYLRLADAIETAISDGTLPAGEKLPPQRNLAFDLGVTIGTVSRAYALVHERGLVSGEVGRGTYVRDRKVASPTAAHDPMLARMSGTRTDGDGRFRFDTTAAPDVGQHAVIERTIGAIVREQPYEVTGYCRTSASHWMRAGAQWLSNGDWSPAPETVVPTLGAHAAVISVINAMTAPGDRIAFETLTYSQISRSASLTGRRLALVESDKDGIIPEDFDKVCAQQHPKLIFLMSSGQNPTCATMPIERRRAIAEIARKYNVGIIEDNLYGAMTRENLPLVTEFAPDLGFVVGGLSKSVAAGVRGGWVSCPPHLESRVRIAHRMLTGGIPFLLTELASRLVLSGEAAEIRRRAVLEINQRQEIANRVLSGLEFDSHPDVPFLWLKLPDPWLSGTFRSAAAREGVLIDEEDEFKPGRMERVFHRVRIGLSQPCSQEDVNTGLSVLRRLLDNSVTGYDSVA